MEAPGGLEKDKGPHKNEKRKNSNPNLECPLPKALEV
jgi:hypothetical protein